MRDGLVLAALVLLISAAALAATAHNCSTTDGSFTIESGDARPSLYCRATDLFPPALTTFHGVAVCVLLFATPFATVIATTVVCARRKSRLPPRLMLAALVMSGFTMVLSLSADVGFRPYF
jgi:hypothetical protein